MQAEVLGLLILFAYLFIDFLTLKIMLVLVLNLELINVTIICGCNTSCAQFFLIVTLKMFFSCAHAKISILVTSLQASRTQPQ